MSGEVFEMVVPVRWADQDLNGHVNNAIIGTYLGEVRVAWRTRAIEIDGIESFRPGAVVATATTHFRRPVHFGPEFRIRTWVESIGNSSYTMAFEGVQSGAVVIEATSVMVAIDEGGAKRMLLPPERAFLERYLPA